MERNIHDFFEQETMPEDCVQRIESALTEESKPSVRRKRWVRTVAVAAALALVLLIGLHFETIQVYADEILTFVTHAINPEAKQLVGRVNENVYRGFNGLVIDNSPDATIGSHGGKDIDLPVQYFAEVVDGRLYFTGNGEYIDITDQCSMDTAFIYVMVDQTGITHYLCVGGTPENWGYSEYLKDESIDDLGAWIGGSGHNHWNNETDEPYGWIIDIKEKIGHPWPI